MIDENIIGNAVFQLNLMLFLTWPTHRGSYIKPILYDAGYRLSYIEHEFAVPIAAALKMTDAGLTANRTVDPEALLEHAGERVVVPLECKRSSFGPTTKQAKQARGYLTLTGHEIATQVAMPEPNSWRGVLTYVSRRGHGLAILSTLHQLITQLTDADITCAKVASLEVGYTDRNITLSNIEYSEPLPGVELSHPRIVMDVYNNVDPRPLYLIPYMPSADDKKDPITERVFIERVRAAVMLLFERLDGSVHEYELDALLARTIQVWHLWYKLEAKRHVRRQAKDLFREVFKDIQAATGITIAFAPKTDRIIVPAMSAAQANKLRKYVLKSVRRKAIDFTAPVQERIDDLLDAE